jgi:hypothetical protein
MLKIIEEIVDGTTVQRSGAYKLTCKGHGASERC